MILTQAEYQRITLDTTTTTDAFGSAAAEAQRLLEEDLLRPDLLELVERSERLIVDRDGCCFPTCTPVTEAGDGLLIVDDVVYGAQPSTSVLTTFVHNPPAFIDLAYTGGYSSETAPAHMVRDLAFVTYAILRPAAALALSGIPGNVSQAQVGDVMVSFTVSGGGPKPSVVGVVWSPATMRLRRIDA